MFVDILVRNKNNISTMHQFLIENEYFHENNRILSYPSTP